MHDFFITKFSCAMTGRKLGSLPCPFSETEKNNICIIGKVALNMPCFRVEHSALVFILVYFAAFGKFILWGIRSQRTQTFLRRLQDVLKSSRRLTTKPDVIRTSGKRRLIYDVLKTSYLGCLKDVQFATS